MTKTQTGIEPSTNANPTNVYTPWKKSIQTLLRESMLCIPSSTDCDSACADRYQAPARALPRRRKKSMTLRAAPELPP